MAGTIISGVIFCIVAMIMLGIGVSQLKSKEPVGFYTGEKPPKVDQLSDVNSWNKKHGVMWIIYGICIIGSWICSAFIGGDSIYSVIPLCIADRMSYGLMPVNEDEQKIQQSFLASQPYEYDFST